MKRICLVGPVDKRAISYPLLKVTMFLGKTLVITDDGVYRRFAENYEATFGFENSDFIVTPLITEEVLAEVEKLKNQYEFIVYITTNEIPPECDKIIYCHGVDKGIANNSTMKVLENTEHIEVVMTFSKVEDATLLKIEPTKSIMAYIYECEDTKLFQDTKDVAYATMLDKFFDKELDIPKASIKGVLQRKG
jgi:hypothetical protein